MGVWRASGGAALACAAAFLVVACSAGDPSQGREREDDPAPSAGPVETEMLFDRQQTGFHEPLREVVRDAERWRAAWATAHAGSDPTPPAPDVDFASHAVVLAAMGRRPTGGHAIAIGEVRRSGYGLLVTVRETAPGGDCMTTQALTAPAVAVRIPAVSGAVTFVGREEVRDCG